jgi:hypothetical protein
MRAIEYPYDISIVLEDGGTIGVMQLVNSVSIFAALTFEEFTVDQGDCKHQ